ncbi:MAG: mannitol dehydrogenase family protein [Pseudomonadota bacterium]
MEQASQTSDPVTLRQVTLDELPAVVAIPSYDRTTLSPGIVHIGLGNFHRAHQAWYLHRLMQQGLATDWAIIGAGVRDSDAKMRERLIDQDCLTTLIELDPDGISAEVTGAMIDFLPVAKDNAPLIAALADPRIRIVSLTVTEGGYYAAAFGGHLDTDHPDIIHDAANPGKPRTAFGAVVAGLRKRRSAGNGPFTVMSCDNLRGNGDITRDTVVGLAQLSDPDLADWIAAEVTFPNAMVDCIVPATGPRELAFVRDFGIDDTAPVTHENFRQWVLEDRFCAGRPPLEKVGVTLTRDVHSFEIMKIRVLNAGHQILANAGEILGHQTISDCTSDPQIRAFFRKVEETEILPFVAPVTDTAPSEYLELIERRFANPAIVDTVRRVAFDGSSRHTEFLLPIVQEALVAGASVEGLALAEALWARMCLGTREDGSTIVPNDPRWADLSRVAAKAETAPEKWLLQSQYYGELAKEPRFADAFDRWLRLIFSDGAKAALSTYVDLR